ncbi:NUDIX hydrolase [Peribacillus kribbensis]|uniref:NUDIX hydrolase n=1 Tax=Peribacillus kribbensis TaxID=356658 RepID=UPI00041D3E4F|nr:NUDIX domain-containing protein [Peribacillus kribbensis]
METELLTIFDDEGRRIGTAERGEAHRKGYWHQAIHCWFISREAGETFIYFQKRSSSKKDYPDLYDITAAGHLLSHETISDGVREVEEELGISVTMEELVSLGVLKYCIEKKELSFIDKEIAHLFLFEYEGTMEDFQLQREEVSGIVKAEFNSFIELFEGKREVIAITGFELLEDGRSAVEKEIGRTGFVPHDLSYYRSVADKITENL